MCLTWSCFSSLDGVPEGVGHWLPVLWQDMTREQIGAEKVALQKALLYYEGIHGRPVSYHTNARTQTHTLRDGWRLTTNTSNPDRYWPISQLKSRCLKPGRLCVCVSWPIYAYLTAVNLQWRVDLQWKNYVVSVEDMALSVCHYEFLMLDQTVAEPKTKASL